MQQYKTKAFWQDIQKEIRNTQSIFLCYASDTFCNVFQHKAEANEYCFDMAQLFLNEHPNWAKFFTIKRGYVLLFKIVIDSENDPNKAFDPDNLRKKVRRDFVNWMINQTV